MQENSKIKAILFDLDDTLLDGRTAQNNAIEDFKGFFPVFKKFEKNNLQEKWRDITMRHYDTYQQGLITFRESRIRRMKELFILVNEDISAEEAYDRFLIYKQLYEKNWVAFTDAIEVLEELKKKYKLGIITNGDSIQQREKIEKIGIEKYFDQITISSEVGHAKPDKEIFRVTCDKLNVNPEECVMVGDKFRVDVEGGRNFGITSIWANRKKENIDYDLQISSLKDLSKFI